MQIRRLLLSPTRPARNLRAASTVLNQYSEYQHGGQVIDEELHEAYPKTDNLPSASKPKLRNQRPIPTANPCLRYHLLMHRERSPSQEFLRPGFPSQGAGSTGNSMLPSACFSSIRAHVSSFHGKIYTWLGTSSGNTSGGGKRYEEMGAGLIGLGCREEHSMPGVRLHPFQF